MKLLLLAHSLTPGGAQRNIVDMARELCARNVEIHVGVFHGGGRLECELESVKEVQLHHLDRKGRWDILGFSWKLRSFLAHHRFDVVYSFLPVPDVLSIVGKTLKRRPKIIWGILASELDYSEHPWRTYLSGKVERMLWPLADHLTCNSQAAIALWSARGVPNTKLSLVTNGVDTKRFSPDSEAYNAVRRELRLPEATVLIGIVGRIDPWKDHKTFLSGARDLRRLTPDVHFLCIGAVDPGMEAYAEELKRYTAQLDLTSAVHWLGDRSDIPRLMAALDILTSSSSTESASTALLEGMACGIPCVVTDVGDSARIVGTTGSVVPPADPVALANAWSKTLALSWGDRQALGVSARSRANELFSIDRMAEEILHVLRTA